MELQSSIFVGSIAAVVLADRLILNRYFPRLRFRQWRLTANLIKFLFWPTCLFKAAEYARPHTATST
jgi:hypothetical protein